MFSNSKVTVQTQSDLCRPRAAAGTLGGGKHNSMCEGAGVSNDDCRDAEAALAAHAPDWVPA